MAPPKPTVEEYQRPYPYHPSPSTAAVSPSFWSDLQGALDMHDGRPPGPYSNTSTSTFAPTDNIPARPFAMYPMSSQITPLSSNSFSNFPSTGIDVGSNATSQGQYQIRPVNSRINQPPSLWPANLEQSPAVGMGSAFSQYDQTLRSSFIPTQSSNNTVPTSQQHYSWQEVHEQVDLGNGVGYQEYLSPDWPPVYPSDQFGMGVGSESRALSQMPHQSSTAPDSTANNFNWPSVCLQCNLPGLNSEHQDVVFDNFPRWLVHFWTYHRDQGQWEACTCYWPGCPSQGWDGKALVFESPRKWLDHAASVHVKDVYCPEVGCEHGRGNSDGNVFGTGSVLKRHTQQKHDRPIYCELQHCRHKRVKLNRTDKRKRHLDLFHGPNCCDKEGCFRGRIDGIDYGFETPKLLKDHMNTHAKKGNRGVAKKRGSN